MSDSDWEVVEVGPALGGGGDDDWEVVAVGAPKKDTSPQTGMQKLGSALMQLVDIPTFGFAEEIGAGGNALIDALSSDATFGESYDRYLNPAREERQQFREENPLTSFGLSLPGAFLVPIGAASGARGAWQTGKALAGAGALQGGLQGFGEGEGFENRLQRGGLGAGVGAVAAPVIGGAISGAGKLINGLPFRQGAQERVVGEQLRDFAGEQGVANLVRALSDDVSMPYGQKTFAELAQTPGAAALETQVRKLPSDAGGNLLDALSTARQGSRLAELQKLVPDFLESSPVQRGELVRALGEPLIDKQMTIGQRMFEDLPRQETISIGDLPQKVGDLLKSAMTDRAQPLPREVARQFDDFINLPSNIPINKAQKLLQEIPEVSQNANLRGEIQSVLSKATGGIREALEMEAQLGNQAAAEFVGKQAVYRDLAQKYKGAVGERISGKGAYGSYQTLEENILRPIISQPTRAKEFVEAFGSTPEMMTQARGALLDDMAAKDKGTWARYFTQKESVFKELFGEDYQAVKKVIDDLASEQTVGRLATSASKGQSATAQFQTVAKELVEKGPALIRALARGGVLTGGAAGIGGAALGLGLPGSVASVGLAYGLSKLAEKAQKNMQGLLLEAIKDPKVARQLIQKATPEVVNATLRDFAIKAAIPNVGSGLASALLGDSSRSEGIQLSLGHQKADLLNPQFAQTSRPTSPTGQGTQVSAYADTSFAPPNQRGNSESIQMPLLQESLRSNFPTSSPNYRQESPATQGESTDMYNPVKWQGKEVPFENLVQAVVQVESAGKPDAVGPKTKYGTAKGSMQILDSTGKWIMEKMGRSREDWDPFNEELNKEAGAWYLKYLLDKFNEDPRLALAAYNHGEGNLARLMKKLGTKDYDKLYTHLPKETRQYVPKVQKNLSIEV